MASAESGTERTTIWRVGASPGVTAAPDLAHILLLRQEDAAPRRLRLGSSPLCIGRAVGNDLVLAAPEISRRHCQVTIADGEAVLTDLESTNGVYVDGGRIAGEVRLAPGARLGIGPFALRYVLGSAGELAAAEAAEQDMARAAAYVAALLPPPLREGAVRADWRFLPSARLGGDAFGYQWIDPGHFAVFLLDVSGHGAGSALLAASAANLLRTRGVVKADPRDPVAILGALNAAFQMDDHGGLFFSLWYGVYEVAARTLRFASAGHHPAYLLTNQELRPLATRAPAIGMAPSPRFTSDCAVVGPGSRLYLFSDGAFEIPAGAGQQWALNDFLPLLSGPVQPNLSEPDRLFAAIRAVTGPVPLEDDVSLIVATFP